jgi:hypothetical protein
MRLIDADALKKDLKSVTLSNGTLVNTNAVLYLLEEYPTAYDVDAVVKQLEMKIDNAEFDELLTSNEKDAYVDAYRRAIEVVKGGGVDE